MSEQRRHPSGRPVRERRVVPLDFALPRVPREQFLTPGLQRPPAAGMGFRPEQAREYRRKSDGRES